MITDATPIAWAAAWRIAAAAGRRTLLGSAILIVAQAALPLGGLIAMQHLVDAIVDGVTGRTTAATAWQAAVWATAVAAAVLFVGHALRAVIAVRSETHGRQLADHWATRLQEHAGRVDLARFDQPAFHDLLHRAGAEASHRPVRLVQDLGAVLTAAVSLVAMAAVAASVTVWMPLVVAAAAAPIAWSRRRDARRRFAWQTETTAAQREVAYLGGTLTGRATAKDVRALGLVSLLRNRMAAQREALRTSLRGLARRRAAVELGVHSLAAGALFGAYLLLAHRALAGELSVGSLVLHAQALQRVQNGVRDLLAAFVALGEDRLFLAPLATFLGLPPGPQAATPAATVPSGPIEILVADVAFTYPEQTRAAIAGVSFRVAAGERVAIVGANGSGKSTLVKLLCRLYDPTTGTVMAQGVDLRQVEPEPWRARIACLFQDAHAFEWTLRENLDLVSRRPSTDAAVARALDVVGLTARVRDLPLGLSSPLSRRLPGGVDWSSGELRRLLLARTLAQRADLLLLDEPFALLDGATAEALAAELRGGDRARTVVVVDHRSVVLTCVDRVLVLEQGRLVASGAPDEVLAREPRLRRLFPDSNRR